MPPLEREPLDPELEALVETRRQEPGPTAADKERLYARLEATLALPDGADSSSSPTGPSPAGPGGAGGAARAGLSGTATKTTVVVIAVAVVAIGIYSVVRSPGGDGRESRGAILEPAPDAKPAADAQSSSTVPRLSSAPERTVAAPVQREEHAAPVKPPRQRKSAARRASPPKSSLGAERALLERARAALARRQAAEAFRELKEHQRRFRRGKLAQERDALLILCLVRLGKHKAARAAGARFRKQHPNSIMLPVVLDALKKTHGDIGARSSGRTRVRSTPPTSR